MIGSRSVKHTRCSAQCAAVLAAFGTLLGSTLARAQAEERVELTWRAPAGCPRAADVRARIRKLTGASGANESRLRAEAVVTRNPDGRYQLKLIVHADDSTGERNIEAKSCQDLAGAAAVSLVLLLGSSPPTTSDTVLATPGAQSTTPDAPQPSAAQTNLLAQPAQLGDPAAEEPQGTNSTREWRALLQLPLALLSIGPLPRPSFGLALGIGIELKRWSFLAEGAGWLKQEIQSPDRTGVSADVRHIDAGLRTCHTFSWGSFELAPCVSVSVRHVWARGAGTHVDARTARATWIAPGIGSMLRLPLGDWFRLFARLDVHLETAQPRISIDGVGQLGLLAPASVSLALGSEWRL